jgi:TPR repeat protein
LAFEMLDSLVQDARQKTAKFLAAGHYASAMQALRHAVTLGHLPSRADLAWLLLHGREGVRADAKTAFQLAVEGTHSGCCDCQGVLAWCYFYGSGSIGDLGACEQDMQKCLELSLKSSQGGSKYGKLALGNLYAGNDRVLPEIPQNYERAAKLIARAAHQNLDAALFRMGVMLETGIGVEQDLVEARRMFRKAADQGFKQAMYATERRGLVAILLNVCAAFAF